jgi:hypothetical protein
VKPGFLLVVIQKLAVNFVSVLLKTEVAIVLYMALYSEAENKA